MKCNRHSTALTVQLNEIYIKVTKEAITETVEMVRNPPSKKFRANLTTILDIKPITADEKISGELTQIFQQGRFENIKEKIKIKIFDFDDAYDDSQIEEYIIRKLNTMGLENKYEFITYGDKIKFIKTSVSNYDDILILVMQHLLHR